MDIITNAHVGPAEAGRHIGDAGAIGLAEAGRHIGDAGSFGLAEAGHHMRMRYAIVEVPSGTLGRLLVAATSRGVCAVAMGSSDAELTRALSREYPAAVVAEDRGPLARWATAILAHLAGRRPRLDLPLDVPATAFQWQVWQALAAIPYGETRTYSEVAASIGRPRAVRAVARACATNPVALAIPCHRVVPAAGGTGGYRWGVARKEALLAIERR